MESFSVLRAQKISQSAETAAHNHNLRASESKTETNVNRSRSSENELLLGSRDTVKTINQIIDDLDLKTAVRKDANRAIELVLSASPEHFYDFEKAGITREQWDELIPANYKDRMNVYWKKIARVQKHFKKDNFEKWKKDTVAWAEKEFGKNIVNLVCHVDEKTPHAHLIVASVVDGKLTAKQFFTPITARKWQDSYSKATGLKRGISSDKKHEDKIANEFNQAKQKGYRKGYQVGKETGQQEAKQAGKKVGAFFGSAVSSFIKRDELEQAEKDKKDAERELASERKRNAEVRAQQSKKHERELQQEQQKTATAEARYEKKKAELAWVLEVGGDDLRKKLKADIDSKQTTAEKAIKDYFKKPRLSVQERQQEASLLQREEAPQSNKTSSKVKKTSV